MECILLFAVFLTFSQVEKQFVIQFAAHHFVHIWLSIEDGWLGEVGKGNVLNLILINFGNLNNLTILTIFVLTFVFQTWVNRFFLWLLVLKRNINRQSHYQYDDDEEEERGDEEEGRYLQYVCPFPFLLTPTKEQWPLDRPKVHHRHHCLYH